MRIVRAATSDVEVISALFEAVGEKIAVINQKFFEDDRNILLIAFSDQEAQGFLYGYLLESVKNRGPSMFLYSIDVLPAYQNRGIGSKLIDELKDIAIQNECSEIFVLTNDSNEIAKKLYQRTGGVRENPDDVMYVYPLS